MAQGRRYIVSYHDGRDIQYWPRYWNDKECRQLIYHVFLLLTHSNPGRFYWCCGLKEALQEYDFDRIRGWIAEHEYKVRELMCWDIRYDPPLTKEELYADYTTDKMPVVS